MANITIQNSEYIGTLTMPEAVLQFT
jgi:hypothetical protein